MNARTAAGWPKPRSGGHSGPTGGWTCRAQTWRLGAAALVTVAALAVTASAFAADDNQVIYPNGAAKAAAPSVTSGSAFNSITLVLAVLLAAVGGWLMWRNRRRAVPGREAKALAIEETRSLGNRQFLVVASYEGKKFLLGVVPGRIDMLAPLHETEEDLG